jgi:hypothetical protein
MIKISLFKLCLVIFPRSLVCVWAINSINMKKIRTKLLILLSIIISIFAYLLNYLPLHAGGYVFVIVGIFIISSHYVNNLQLEEAICSSLIIIILLSICEFDNVMLLKFLYIIRIQNMLCMPLKILLISLPAPILFTIFILIFNKFNRKNIISNRNMLQ